METTNSPTPKMRVLTVSFLVTIVIVSRAQISDNGGKSIEVKLARPISVMDIPQIILALDKTLLVQ